MQFQQNILNHFLPSVPFKFHLVSQKRFFLLSPLYSQNRFALYWDATKISAVMWVQYVFDNKCNIHKTLKVFSPICLKHFLKTLHPHLNPSRFALPLLPKKIIFFWPALKHSSSGSHLSKCSRNLRDLYCKQKVF